MAISVKRSKISGLGLFADKNYKKGDFVIQYAGKKVPIAEFEKMASNRYIYEFNTKWVIDGSSRENKARYINHSCRPNLEPFIGKAVRLYALKAIRPGDELTVNYGKEYRDYYFKGKCRCAACK